MNTNKIVLRTVDEFMGGYTPVYKPIYPLFLGKSQQYPAEVGKQNFRRVSTIGDIRAHHVTPKDTELKQIAVNEGQKTFKKYFMANQYTQSQLQDSQGIEDVTAQVLDEHQVQMDELFLTGEGTSNSNMINNGLYFSNDPYYTTESSYEVQKDTNGNYLLDLHGAIMNSIQKANETAGRKLILFYGTSVLPLFNGLYPTAVVPFKTTLQQVAGDGFSFVQIPSNITPAGAQGWIVANMEQTKLHFTSLPALLDQGVNNEKMYTWANFMLGSCMLEVLAKNAVIRQPITLEA